MQPSEIENKLQQLLADTNVEVVLGSGALNDLKSYRKEITTILALIYKQALRGPLIKPDGYGEPLIGKLLGFTKIKPKAMALRIVYRPVLQSNGMIRMEIIAIGPRDKDKVYNWADERVESFKTEMSKEETNE
ncbi:MULTISPECIES: hypothetical protein [unclassified Paenibacillus]|uniref:hypothetical protein n=1 Tax=unclassified Paenibacillus TaxID=185978 RepID=UPI000970073A|nr:hypothetical protein BK146_14640 [Paenibacillus sp. FSL R7-0333]